ncbi:MAG: hypothetical protein V2J07_11975 [Anaerolineae bacterium]|jgi:hypothetical protein|nr:hypothetical protein [Anaerolineae bacterium]
MMNTKDSIREAYDKAAHHYTENFWHELDGKPFDRQMLRWFMERIPENETILELGAGLREILKRYPYEGTEYPSKHAYFVAVKPK